MHPFIYLGAGSLGANERMGTSVSWGDVFGDQTIASAMIDRIVHHAEVISLTGASYRLKRHQPADTAQ